MNYRDKYIKYKTKYIELKNIQIGNGEATAKNNIRSYIKKINNPNKFNNPENFKVIFIKNLKLTTEEEEEEIKSINLENTDDENINNIYNRIIQILEQVNYVNEKSKKTIKIIEFEKKKYYSDFLVSLYTKTPPDIPQIINKKEIIKLLNKHYELINNGINVDLSKNDYLVQINEKYAELEIKTFNEDDIITVLKTPNLIIYQPKTIEASGCYGRNTKWCTRKITDGVNRFKDYSKIGPLYIIIPRAQLESKSDEEKFKSYKEKYQFHFETASFMDEMDNPIDPYILIEKRFKDDIFREWVKEKIKIISTCEEYKNKPESKEPDKIIIKDHIQLLCLRYFCYNPNIKSITFEDKFKYETLKGLPNYDSITELNLGGGQNINYNNLPFSLKSITFGNSFNEELPVNFRLMENLQIINLGDLFNQTLEKLPGHLKSIIIGNDFNQKLPKKFLYAYLKLISLGNNFNQTLENLPRGLEELKLGDNFNQTLENLPSSLETIALGNSFNQTLENLPSSLKKLKLGDSFNTSVDFSNLNKLFVVSFGKNFRSTFKLPTSIKEIYISKNYEITDPNPTYIVRKLDDYVFEMLSISDL